MKDFQRQLTEALLLSTLAKQRRLLIRVLQVHKVAEMDRLENFGSKGFSVASIDLSVRFNIGKKRCISIEGTKQEPIKLPQFQITKMVAI